MGNPGWEEIMGVAFGVMKKLVQAVVLAAGLAVSTSAAMAEDVPHHFVFHITSDDAWTVGSALTQAVVASERGHDVTVILSVRGVHLAETNSAQGGFSVTARTPRDMLADLIEDGHSVLVCGVCMVAGGVMRDELIEGAEITGPELTFTALTAPDTIVLSY
jgi:predicted peroxiredoxin